MPFLAVAILGLRFASGDLFIGALVVVLVVGTLADAWYAYSRRRQRAHARPVSTRGGAEL